MTTTRLTRLAPAAFVLALLTACGGGGHDAPATERTAAKGGSASASPRTSASGSSSNDAPIGDGDISMSTASAQNMPADQLSGPGAGDCYSGGSRIYDRHGVTCGDARGVVEKYEASPGSTKGTTIRIGALTCSHNPQIMVTQGAAPGTCVDSSNSVVLNWRYPGAPQPARS